VDRYYLVGRPASPLPERRQLIDHTNDCTMERTLLSRDLTCASMPEPRSTRAGSLDDFELLFYRGLGGGAAGTLVEPKLRPDGPQGPLVVAGWSSVDCRGPSRGRGRRGLA